MIENDYFIIFFIVFVFVMGLTWIGLFIRKGNLIWHRYFELKLEVRNLAGKVIMLEQRIKELEKK